MKDFIKSSKTITIRSKETVAIYFRDINHTEPLSPNEEADLARIIRMGGPEANEARDRLIKANLKFVVTVANQYKSHMLELSDLINEGNIGLIKAAEMFDDTKGFKFISYAVWWIRQSIMAAIDKSNTTLRLPSNQQRILRRFNLMQHDMMQKEQRPITVDEFCAVSGLDPMLVSRLLESSVKPLNMDQKITNDTDSTFGDLIPSESVTDSKLNDDSLHTDLNDLINNILSEREAHIVRHLFGFGCKPNTLDEIANELHISRERVRQLNAHALNRIRKSPYASRLLHYLAA